MPQLENPPPTGPSKVLTTQARQKKNTRISYYAGAPVVLAPPPINYKS